MPAPKRKQREGGGEAKTQRRSKRIKRREEKLREAKHAERKAAKPKALKSHAARSKKSGPHDQLLASLVNRLRYYIPAVYRVNTKYCSSLLEMESDLKRRASAHSSGTQQFLDICLEKSAILPLDGRSRHLNARSHPRPSTTFFIPSPFRPELCVNAETTLLSDVKSLTKCLVRTPLELCCDKKLAQKALRSRKSIAFGNPDGPYTLYELEELNQAWKARGDFVIPDHMESYFPDSQIDCLSRMLDMEFRCPIASQVQKTIDEVQSSQRHGTQRLKRLSTQWPSLSPADRNQILDCLKWIFMAGLFMRGWNGHPQQFPITSKACASMSPWRARRLHYALGVIQGIVCGFSAQARAYYQSCFTFYLMAKKGEKKSALQFDAPQETRASWSDDDDEDDQKPAEILTLTPQGEKELHVLNATLFKDMKSQRKKRKAKANDDPTRSLGNFHCTIQNDHLSSIVEHVMRGEQCIRDASREFIQTSAIYLQLLAKQHVPEIPLELLECVM